MVKLEDLGELSWNCTVRNNWTPSGGGKTGIIWFTTLSVPPLQEIRKASVDAGLTELCQNSDLRHLITKTDELQSLRYSQQWIGAGNPFMTMSRRSKAVQAPVLQIMMTLKRHPQREQMHFWMLLCLSSTRYNWVALLLRWYITFSI